MTTALPAIRQHSGKMGQQNMQQHHMPSPPVTARSPSMSTKSYLKPMRRSLGKKEKEMLMRQAALRSQQPELTKRETAAYRNTYMHNLCLDMLQEGFHRSFSELFALVKRQYSEREAAGPESMMWTQMMLDEEHEKLEMLKVFLTRAEAALRKDDYEEVYNARYQLAKYFQSTGDKWLSDHFYTTCLDTSGSIKANVRFQAEAHCNVGLALEESGDYFNSAEQLENFHTHASEHKDWVTNEGVTLHAVSCNHLMRVYTTIGNKLEANKEQEASLSYFVKAYNMAVEGGDLKLKGESSYRLGLAYEKAKDSETALLYLNDFLETCKQLNDDVGIGQACEAIAKSYESLGKINESIRYLEQFCEVAERSKQEKAYSKACSNLGAVFNSLGKYDKATEYFSKAYNLSRALNDQESIKTSRVHYGVAMAHNMMQGFCNHLITPTKPSMERQVEWKSTRVDEFSKEIPQEKQEQEQPSTTPASHQTQSEPASRDVSNMEPAATETAPATEGEGAPSQGEVEQAAENQEPADSQAPAES
ncbi:tetratricopeptide repeat protein 29 [Lingula anatina]|uniref:Tetratricopeptide repeat protein 29 n=1 Tax=Lingula anatina TaxID=7574 RepID=A0A1S3IPJ3_LINAN|nr:tetratricopeptide repeat protein 29 [Lingula anatina]|eukprot:XP_013400140.1 tetratricopeptide repeat protein 29 [Lingula anatina]